MGKNPTTPVYSETTKQEKILTKKKTLKMQKYQNDLMLTKVMQALIMLIF